MAIDKYISGNETEQIQVEQLCEPLQGYEKTPGDLEIKVANWLIPVDSLLQAFYFPN